MFSCGQAVLVNKVLSVLSFCLALHQTANVEAFIIKGRMSLAAPEPAISTCHGLDNLATASPLQDPALQGLDEAPNIAELLSSGHRRSPFS
ncbi:hypothetical protein BDW71DRAFT_182040 [Aspergillus fruticulosus]